MNKEILAYVIGLAIGDGNLSNPNGRAVRLRISCDTLYPKLIERISFAIQSLMPNNKVSLVAKKGKRCLDVSCYSNQWPLLLSWKPGAKINQSVQIPAWIKENEIYTIACLRGLIETDGAVYLDRNYLAVIFTSIMKNVSDDVLIMIQKLGFKPKIYAVQPAPNNGKSRKKRYNVRLTKNVEKFLQLVPIEKS